MTRYVVLFRTKQGGHAETEEVEADGWRVKNNFVCFYTGEDNLDEDKVDTHIYHTTTVVRFYVAPAQDI